MTQEVDANLNSVDCIVTKTHFGYDTIINICTGAQQSIDWAFGDWLAGGLVTLFVGTACLVLCTIAYMIITDR